MKATPTDTGELHGPNLPRPWELGYDPTRPYPYPYSKHDDQPHRPKPDGFPLSQWAKDNPPSPGHGLGGARIYETSTGVCE